MLATTQETAVRDDLYRVLRRIAHATDQATAHEAAVALRLACEQGRVYGMSYGYRDAGCYIGCALAHLVHAVMPQRMEQEEANQDIINEVMGYPHAGGVLEEYVLYVPRGSRPQDNQYVANIVNWLTDYIDD